MGGVEQTRGCKLRIRIWTKRKRTKKSKEKKSTQPFPCGLMALNRRKRNKTSVKFHSHWPIAAKASAGFCIFTRARRQQHSLYRPLSLKVFSQQYYRLDSNFNDHSNLLWSFFFSLLIVSTLSQSIFYGLSVAVLAEGWFTASAFRAFTRLYWYWVNQNSNFGENFLSKA